MECFSDPAGRSAGVDRECRLSWERTERWKKPGAAGEEAVGKHIGKISSWCSVVGRLKNPEIGLLPIETRIRKFGEHIEPTCRANVGPDGCGAILVPVILEGWQIAQLSGGIETI